MIAFQVLGSLETGRGGATVPGSPRSGLRAEFREGPNPVGELPAGTQPGVAMIARKIIGE